MHFLKSLLYSILIFVSVSGCGLFEVKAEETGETGELISESFEYINSSYADEELLSVELFTAKEETQQAVSSEEETESFYTVSDAAAAVKNAMKERTDISLHLKIPKTETNADYSWEKLVKEIVNKAQAHTGIPDEGDYIHYQYGKYNAKMTHTADETVFDGKVSLTFMYYTSYEQEEELSYRINTVLQTLDLNSKNEINKLREIYRYICTNVSYDNANLNDNTYKLKYTAYAALINGTAVCQGYANLLYRMALEAGIDTRIIEGTGNSVPHAWNIVRFLDSYSFADATWDSNFRDNDEYYSYFLKNTPDMVNHYNMSVWNDTDALGGTYPIAESSYIRVAGVEFSENSDIVVKANDTFTADAYAVPLRATIPGISISVVSGDCIRINEDQTFTALKEGIAVIRAETDDGGYTAEMQVIVPGLIRDGTHTVYYFPDGTKAVSEWALHENQWYYFGTDGYMTTGWQKISDKWYYLNEAGIMQTGWLKNNDRWYWLKDSGAMATGWYKISDKWYFFNGSGSMWTGWLENNDKWYWLKDSGAMATGWYKISDKWYFFNGSGSMQTGWLENNDRWYWLKDSGAMTTGWYKISDKWYFFNGSGSMQTGWLKNNDRWYWLKDSGAMATGWQKISGKWYYFTGSGAMKTGWLKINGKWYWLKSSGEMATGKQRINGKLYTFDKNGVME